MAPRQQDKYCLKEFTFIPEIANLAVKSSTVLYYRKYLYSLKSLQNFVPPQQVKLHLFVHLFPCHCSLHSILFLIFPRIVIFAGNTIPTDISFALTLATLVLFRQLLCTVIKSHALPSTLMLLFIDSHALSSMLLCSFMNYHMLFHQFLCSLIDSYAVSSTLMLFY